MSELPDQSGDVGNDRVLKQGEAAHDGCRQEEKEAGSRVKTTTRTLNTTEEGGAHLS